MNVVKMKVVIGSWLTLALIAGFNTGAVCADESHAGKDAAGASRPAAVQVPLPAEYETLAKGLSLVDSRGLTVKEAELLDATKKDVTVAIGDVTKLKNWVETFKKYRESLTSCAVAGDISSDVTGRLLDGFITKLSEAITEDPKNAKGLKEKHLVTFVTQMERVLKEKASIFSSSKADFEKADEKLLDQMKKTAGLFYGGFHGEAFNQIAQAGDAWAKPFTEEATKAIEALKARESGSLKVCKMSEEKPATTAETAPPASPSPASQPTTAAATKPKLDPGPIEGGNKEEGEGTGDQARTDDPGTGDPVIDQPVIDDGQVPFIEPANDVATDFDADALLRGVVDRFAQLEEQAKLDQERTANDLKAAFDQAKLQADAIAAQQAAALQAQDNEDNGLADALKALTPQPPPPPPAPPAPPVIPPQIPPSDSGQQAQQPLPPPQEDFGGQQPPPQQGMPFMPPQQQQSTPPIIIGDDSSKWDDDYRRTPVPVPVANPQAGGLLELVRLQQQLAFAQQQAMYGQQGPNGARLNVNTMANRVGGGGYSATANRRAVGGTTSVQSGNVAGGRTTAPAALRGSLAK